MTMVTVTLPPDTNSKWEKILPADFKVEFFPNGNGTNTFYVIPQKATQKHLFDDGGAGTPECYTVPSEGLTLAVQPQAGGAYTISLEQNLDEPNPNDGEIIVDSVGPGGYEIQVKSHSGLYHRFEYKRPNP